VSFLIGTPDVRTNGGPSVLRSVSLALLVALSMLVVMALAKPPEASATVGCMCPSSCVGTITISAYPGRCVHSFHSGYNDVWYENDAGTAKCAVVKPNSDGSGGDQGASAVCAGGTSEAHWHVGGSGVPGYGVGINDSNHSSGGFWGSMAFFP
jgi:hypothetical protein